MKKNNVLHTKYNREYAEVHYQAKRVRGHEYYYWRSRVCSSFLYFYYVLEMFSLLYFILTAESAEA
jgi:hypothetical protein